MQTLLFVLIAIVVLALVAYGQYKAAQRRAELRRWARSLGLTFSEARDRTLDDRFPQFGCLRQGDNRYANNMMEGRYREYTLQAFDYHYETHSTDSKGRRQTHHHAFSAVILSTNVTLKPLSIRTETIFDKVGAFFGWEDINFESAEFSREFCVTSPDRRWAFDVLSQKTMEFLLAAPRFSIQFGDRSVLAYRGSTFSIEDFLSAIKVIDRLLSHIPPTVLNELRGATT